MRGRCWFHVCCCWLQGRLIDHLRNTQSVGLEDLQALVLDEADRLLQMGFAEEVSYWCFSHASGAAQEEIFRLHIGGQHRSTRQCACSWTTLRRPYTPVQPGPASRCQVLRVIQCVAMP